MSKRFSPAPGGKYSPCFPSKAFFDKHLPSGGVRGMRVMVYTSGGRTAVRNDYYSGNNRFVLSSENPEQRRDLVPGFPAVRYVRAKDSPGIRFMEGYYDN